MKSLTDNSQNASPHSSAKEHQSGIQKLILQLSQITCVPGKNVIKTEITEKVVLCLSRLELALLNVPEQEKQISFNSVETCLMRMLVGAPLSSQNRKASKSSNSTDRDDSKSNAASSSSSSPQSDMIPVSIAVVRRSVCRCINALYSRQLHLVPKAVNRLFELLNTFSLQKIVSKYQYISCLLHALGTMYACAALYMPPLLNLSQLFTKFWKFNSDLIKFSILDLIRSYVNSSNKGISNEWSELVKHCQKAMNEKNIELRRICAECFVAMGKRMTAQDANSKNLDACISYCVKNMEDTDSKVRQIYGMALGYFMFGVMQDESTIQATEEKSTKSLASSFSFKKRARTFNFSSALFTITGSFARVGSSRQLREALSNSVINFLKQCPTQMILSNIDIVLHHLIGLIVNSKIYITSSDQLYTQNLIGNILRSGLTFHLNESGRETALTEFTKAIQKYEANEYAVACLSSEIAVLCTSLGEISFNHKDIVLHAILLCLKHPNEYVRYVGAFCMRSLAEAMPSQTQTLVAALVNMVQIDHAELAVPLESDNKFLLRHTNSLHGHANGLAALIVVTSRNTLSIDHLLCSATLDTASLLFTGNANINPYILMRRQEACWVLISSVLTLNDYWVKMNLEKIIDLWDSFLGTNALTKLPTDETELSYHLRTRASAIQSLLIFLRYCSSLVNAERISLIYKFIADTIDMISNLPSSFKPTLSGTLIAMNTLKMYIFEIFRSMPGSVLSQPQNRSVINFITKMAFAEADASINSIQTSLLDTILSSPSIADQESKASTIDDDDILNDADLRNEIDDVKLQQDTQLEVDSSLLFLQWRDFNTQQMLSINTRLVDASIKLLGRIFSYHRPNSKLQIVEHLVHQLKIALSKPDDIKSSVAIFSNVIANMYYILSHMVKRHQKIIDDKNLISNIHSILNASLSHVSIKVRRVGAHSMALMGKLIGDALMEDLFKRCAAKIIKEGPVKAGYAMAIGTVNRALGSLVSHKYLPTTVSFLQTLARSENIETQVSALQSLKHTVDTLGISFSLHVESILLLISQLLFSSQKAAVLSDSYTLVGCGKVIDALIGLGPEIVTSNSYEQLFHYFVIELLCHEQISVQIEGAKLVEHASILAPSLLSPLMTYVINRFANFLNSPISTAKLRRVTASCIKIISEKEPKLIGNTFSLETLFLLLNQVEYEDEAERVQYQEIIYFLAKSKVFGPSKWINLIYRIVLSQPKKYESEMSNNVKGAMISDTDDKGENNEENNAKLKISNLEKQKNATDICGETLFTWNAKIFALKCLKQLISIYCNDQIHIDLVEARKEKTINKSSDFLVLHLDKIVEICTSATSRGSSSTRNYGILVLQDLVEVFDEIKDPDVPSESLLHQYSASFGTALNPCFDSSQSPPMLMNIACQLASLYIPSKMLANQINTVQRLLSHLTGHLHKLHEFVVQGYGEEATAMVKVAIVSALANIMASASKDANQELYNLLVPHTELLLDYWNKLLLDYANLIIIEENENDQLFPVAQSKDSVQRNTSYLYQRGIEKQVIKYYSKAYPHVLSAFTRMLVPSKRLKKQMMKDSTVSLQAAPNTEKILTLEDVNPILIVGLASRALTQQRPIRDIVACIDAAAKFMKTQGFASLAIAPSVVIEILITLIRIQKSREHHLQFACLRFLKSVLKLTNSSFFNSIGGHQHVIGVLIEGCLKPLRLYFPLLFKQDSEHELSNLNDALGKDQIKIAKKVLECIEILIQKFTLTDLHLSMVCFTLCRLLQFAKLGEVLNVVQLLISKCSASKSEQEIFVSCIENISNRIEKGTITSSDEVILAFTFIQGMDIDENHHLKPLTIKAHEKLLQSLLLLMNHQSIYTDLHMFRVLDCTLQGIQDSVVRLARAGRSQISMLYIGRLSGPIVALLAKICRDEVNVSPLSLKEVQEKNTILFQDYKDEKDVKKLKDRLIVHTVAAGLNILLAAYNMVEKSKRSGFLLVTIPLLSQLLKFTMSSSSPPMKNLFKLSTQCLERFAASSPQEFKNLVGQMPKQVVEEIQNAAKQKLKQTQNTKQETLNINFSAYSQ